MSDIQLQISGKQIDTIPIINLLRQGENNADTILMQLPPKYGDIALDELTYIMYGDSKSGTRANQTLEKEANSAGVLLRWEISKDFTAVAGELKLILKGFLPDGNPIIKWVGGVINVYCDPAGGFYPPPVSEVEQAIKEMYTVLSKAEQSAEKAALSEQSAQASVSNAQISASNAQASAAKAERVAQSIQGEAQKIEQATQAGIAAVDNAGKGAISTINLASEGEVSKISDAGSVERQKVITEGAKQIQAATEQANLAKQSADNAASKAQEVAQSVDAGKQEIATAKDAAVSAVQDESSKQVQAVNAAGTVQTQAVNDAGKTQISAISGEGVKQVQAVADAGAAQVQAVGAEGQKQVEALQAEGTKQAEKIKAIESLLPAPTAQDKGKVPMVDAGGTGYKLGEVVVDAYTKAESDKRYMPLAAAIKPTASGELVTLSDSADFALQGLKIYGKSTQDGVPTPEAPVPIVSVGDSGSITLTLTDTAEQRQEFSIPTPNGLSGIPVKSGGNYTDSKGQWWVCDEIDFARGKWVQRVRKTKLSSLSWKMSITSSNKNYNFNGDIRPYNAAEKAVPSICTILPFKDVLWDGEPSTLPKSYCWGYNATLSFPPDSPINSLEALQNLISQTSAEVAYTLATPIEHDLSPELIAAYQKLHTYYPTTNLFASDNAGIEVQYLADTKNYIDSKIKALTNAVIGGI